MKKLKLSELNLGGSEVLTREQLKKVLGGTGSGSDDSGSGSGDDSGSGFVGSSCDITCKDGYYACCTTNILMPYCKCYPDNETHTCTDGGVGTLSCSATI